MAWIAAIISAVGGLAAGAAQKSASTKATKGAGVNLTQAYGQAREGLQPYGDVGTQGVYGLAELMGLEGYRTAEEQALTKHLQSKPTLRTVAAEKDKWKSLVQSHPGGELGVNLGGAVAGLPGIGTLAMARGKKKEKEAAIWAAMENARLQKEYDKQLAEWETKRAELEQASNMSLANYDPGAALRSTPGYQFRYGEGLRAVQSNQAARNNTLSGRALKELTQYGQGFGSTEYQNEFARRMQLANMGQGAQTTLGNLSIGQGTGLANLQLQQGAANADYYSTVNNALQSGLGNYLTYRDRQNQQSGVTPYTSSYTPSSTSSTPIADDWATRMNQQYLS